VAELTHTVMRDKTESSLNVIVGNFVLITLVRLAGLATSSVDLFTDEAQYWSWSRELSWGYFSKPPLIAWIIHVAESLCGSSEACVRAPSPIFYFGTCVVINLIGRKLYGPVVGLWHCRRWSPSRLSRCSPEPTPTGQQPGQFLRQFSRLQCSYRLEPGGG